MNGTGRAATRGSGEVVELEYGITTYPAREDHGRWGGDPPEPVWLWRFSVAARHKLRCRQQGTTPAGRQVQATAVSVRFSVASAPFQP